MIFRAVSLLPFAGPKLHRVTQDPVTEQPLINEGQLSAVLEQQPYTKASFVKQRNINYTESSWKWVVSPTKLSNALS